MSPTVIICLTVGGIFLFLLLVAVLISLLNSAIDKFRNTKSILGRLLLLIPIIVVGIVLAIIDAGATMLILAGAFSILAAAASGIRRKIR